MRTNTMVVGSLLLLLLGAALLGAWLWLGGEAGDAFSARSSFAREVAAAEIASAEGDHAAGSGAPTDRSAAATPSVSVEAAVSGEPAVAPAGGILVQFVDGVSGAPVSGAEVIATPPRLTDRQRFAIDIQRRRGDPFFWLAEVGQRATTDAAGCVGLRCGVGSLEVACRKDDLYGYRNVILSGLTAARVVVTMARDQQVTVRVVDAARRAVVGMPIGVVCERRRPGATQPDEVLAMVGETDPAGVCVVRHLQQVRLAEQADALAIAAVTPGLRGTKVAWNGASDVELVVHEIGSVVVHVVDREGRPVPADVPCLVSLLRRDDPDLVSAAPPLEAWVESEVDHQPLIAGVATFHGVPVGQHLLVSAEQDSLQGACEAEGPNSHGATVAVELRLDGDEAHPGLVRCVDSLGAPVADAAVVVARRNAPENVLTRFDTDASGAGRLALNLAANDRLVFSTVVPGTGCLCGQRDGASPPAGAGWGDVVLAPAPIVARGRLIDHGARPPGLSLGADTRFQTRWRSDPSYAIALADDGSFAISKVGEPRGTEHRLRVHAAICQPVPPIPFAHGQDDLVVDLVPGFGLRCRALVPAEAWRMFSDGDLEFELTGDDDVTREMAVDFVGGELWLAVGGLRSGTYSLSVSGSSLPLLTLTGLALAPDRPLDPRLDPLDLRDVLQVMRIRTMSTAGAPLDTTGSVMFRTESSEGWVGWVYVRHGVAECPVPTRQVDVMVLADGYSPVLREAVAGSFDVALLPRRRVPVVVRGAPAASVFANWPDLIVRGPAIERLGLQEYQESFGSLDMWDEAGPGGLVELADLPGLEVVLRWEVEGADAVELRTVVLPGTRELVLEVPPAVAARFAKPGARD